MTGSDNNWHDAGRNSRSYLLRCWQEEGPENRGEPGDPLVWRFALVQLDDDAHTKGFICLEDLFGYLHGRLIQAGSQATNQGGSSTVGSELSRLEFSRKREESET